MLCFDFILISKRKKTFLPFLLYVLQWKMLHWKNVACRGPFKSLRINKNIFLILFTNFFVLFWNFLIKEKKFYNRNFLIYYFYNSLVEKIVIIVITVIKILNLFFQLFHSDNSTIVLFLFQWVHVFLVNFLNFFFASLFIVFVDGLKLQKLIWGEFLVYKKWDWKIKKILLSIDQFKHGLKAFDKSWIIFYS